PFSSCPHPPPTYIYTLSLHDALPIYPALDDRAHPARDHRGAVVALGTAVLAAGGGLDGLAGHLCRNSGCFFLFHAALSRAERGRSEEHTSELQSRENLVCRLLLEKKK